MIDDDGDGDDAGELIQFRHRNVDRKKLYMYIFCITLICNMSNWIAVCFWVESVVVDCAWIMSLIAAVDAADCIASDCIALKNSSYARMRDDNEITIELFADDSYNEDKKSTNTCSKHHDHHLT